MKKLTFFIIILFLLFQNIYADIKKVDGLTAEEILKKVDDNFIADTRISVSRMIITGRRSKRTIKVKTWVMGEEKAFTEYIDPPREKGTKMLKLGTELWIFTPTADRIIKIAGHMLRQSMSGSDVSYEDFTEDQKLTNLYDTQLIGEENIDNNLCFVLKLIAKKQDIAYHTRKLWVDKSNYLPLKEERFARSGKLLKVFKINEVFKVGDRTYPKIMIFKDVLKKGKGTQFIIDSIKFNVDIPAYIFSKASLRK